MPSAVRLRGDYSAEELRALARRSKDVNQSRRLLSLAAVRDGMDRGSAARIGGMDRQTLRDWVHRFNAAGPEGLIDNWTEGPKPRLSAEQVAEFAVIVETGPDRERDGVVRWRRADLKRVIAGRFGVAFHERYVGKLLKKLGFSHMSARPRHPAQDERIVTAFKNVWPAPSARGLSRLAADPVCFNVSGLEELPPAMMEIRTLESLTVSCLFADYDAGWILNPAADLARSQQQQSITNLAKSQQRQIVTSRVLGSILIRQPSRSMAPTVAGSLLYDFVNWGSQPSVCRGWRWRDPLAGGRQRRPARGAERFFCEPGFAPLQGMEFPVQTNVQAGRFGNRAPIVVLGN